MMPQSLTVRSGGARRHSVPRFLGFLIGFALFLSMGMGAAAHASEQICLSGTEMTSAIGHADGDADQTPDADKGYPHHHGGCHGHHMAAPVAGNSPAKPLPRRSATVENSLALVAIAPPGAALRPPIA
jgi:hypothetical protein